MKGLARLRRLRRETSGVSAVEFALILPLLLLIFFGGYAVSDAITIRRKLSITTRTLGDLTTQVAALSTTDMAAVLSASAQVMAPYNTAPLSIRQSEIVTDLTGLIATVAWSTVSGQGMTALPCNQIYILPITMYKPSSSYVLTEVSYAFTPNVGYGISGTLTLSDHMFMVPRISQSVAYTCPG